MNKAYIEEVVLAKKNPDLEQFFDYVNRNFSDDHYTEIQLMHLSIAALRYIKEQNWVSPEIKYIDFAFWAASKFPVAKKLRLHETSGLKILDLGAGPGHFGVVCNYFNHDFVSLDLPHLPKVPGTDKHLYDDLCNFFRITKVSGRIKAGTPLGLGERFDVVTGLMGTFTVIWEMGKVVRPWGWEEWRFFLNDLLTNHATSNIRMYFQISRAYMPPEVWSKLESLAVEAIPAAMVLIFDSTLFERLHTT